MKRLLQLILLLGATQLAIAQTSEVMSHWETVSLEMNGVFSNGSFADSLFGATTNPNPSGINTSDNVQLWKKATDAQAWAGFYYDLTDSIDLTGDVGQLCMDVYGESEFMIRTKIEMSGDGGGDASFDRNYTTPGEWQQICIDLMGESNDGSIGKIKGFKFGRLTYFPGREGVPATETAYYIDNIKKTTGQGTTEAMALWDPLALEMSGVFSNGYFADSLFGATTNPNPSGINTSDNVQLWKKATDAQAWAGFYYDLTDSIDLTGDVGELCMDVYGESEFMIRTKIELSGDGGSDASFDRNYTTPGEWQQICVDLMGESNDGSIGKIKGFKFGRLTYFPGREGVPDTETAYYIDNITKTTGSAGGIEDAELISDYEPSGVTVPIGGSFGNGSFGDSLFLVMENPSPDAVNSSSMVQEWCKASDAMTWGGFYMDVDTIDFTGTKATICVSMYAEEANNLQCKLEGSETGPDLNIDLEYTTPGEWQQLCFDFTQPDINGNVGLGHLYHRITWFPDFGTVPAADNCYYLDDIFKITNGGGASLELIGTVIENSPDHTTLSSLLSVTDLWGAFNASGVTVFAPTDDAFDALPTEVMDALMENTNNITYNALLHHLVTDSLPADALTQDLRIISRNGQDLVVTAAGSSVGNANVIAADIPAVNGLLHVTDAVFDFPEDPNAYTHVDYGDPEYFQTATYFNTNSADAMFRLVANPDQSGINPNDSVAEFIKYPTGAWFQGLYFDLDRPISLMNDMTTFCIKAYFSVAGPIRAKLEMSPTGGPIATWEEEVTAANEWQEICFDMTGKPIQEEVAAGDALNHIYNRITFFFNVYDGVVPEEEEPHLYDGLVQKKTSVATEEIKKLENFKFYPNPTTDMINVESDTPIDKVAIFDVSGRNVMSANNPVRNNINVSNLQSGMYFAHFIDEKGNSLGSVRFIKM